MSALYHHAEAAILAPPPAPAQPAARHGVVEAAGEQEASERELTLLVDEFVAFLERVRPSSCSVPCESAGREHGHEQQARFEGIAGDATAVMAHTYAPR